MLANLFGHKRKLNSFVSRVHKHQSNLDELGIQELKDALSSLRDKYASSNNRLTLDDLSKVFAITSLASGIVLEKKHYDSQIMGGFVLAEHGIAEMRTGEGKTLVAALPAISCFVRGKKAHVATTNEYLAARDASELMPLFEALGVSVGVITGSMDKHAKKASYACDVAYSTVSELGFDYLRDKMVVNADDRVQSSLDYILVDEADSLLIDMGVTPLVMSGQSKRDSSVFAFLYPVITEFEYVNEKDIDDLNTVSADVSYDVKSQTVTILDSGYLKLEKLLLDNGLVDQKSLYQDEGIALIKAAEKCMDAFIFKQCDIDYLVVDGKVYFVDQNTGRASSSRRWGDGLHQALEAKEGVEIQPETETVASIAIQNFVGLYKEFSGMTGTALTAKKEFKELYHTDVVSIPTNKPIIRVDNNDLIYGTKEEKWDGVISRVKEASTKGQPVLIGTNSVEDSDLLSAKLKEQNVEHNLLSAKHHEQEAAIIAQAGRPGAVTIATNMAGRGTDILLGGNATQMCKALDIVDNEHFEAVKEKCISDKDAVLKAGGLLVIGTERSDSRRIDDQLIGRSGRQGDPGETQFFISIEDTLIQRFAGQAMKKVWDLSGLSESGEGIYSKTIDNAIASLQTKAEAMHTEVRKNTKQYDSINQSIRSGFYDIRDHWVDMSEQDIQDLLPDLCEECVSLSADGLVNAYGDIHAERKKALFIKALYEWQLDVTEDELNQILSSGNDQEFIVESLTDLLIKRVNSSIDKIGPEIGLQIARRACLTLLDEQWVRIQSDMRELHSGSHLKGYAQKNPITEYRKEADQLLKSSIVETEMLVVECILDAISEQLDLVELASMNVEYDPYAFWIHPDFRFPLSSKIFCIRLITSEGMNFSI
ncbi:DEAD/DEAH box helicase [Photobacterium leiognathi]|uniref:preprotein translocase subunit SecA n=1 Tax=Photobacterium leiognathi TaxID=553611 RepID=UPI001EDFD117|nr:DEAD/DEAH box helicase [Photobacterium leiognathi]MCG3883360.1 DEAD/DEAH box helicase [Photobacterium leiognathi]